MYSSTPADSMAGTPIASDAIWPKLAPSEPQISVHTSLAGRPSSSSSTLLSARVTVISKPFSPKELLEEIRKLSLH
jgi:hypothetical protein